MIGNFALKSFLKSLESIQYGSLEVITPDGKIYYFQGKDAGSNANIKIYKNNVITNLVAKGDVGFAEDYRDGNWDSDDLESLVFIALKNQEYINSYINGGSIFKVISQISYYLRKNSLSGSKRNVQAHYDLGNDFYKLWLDETMTYSGAIFNGSNNLVQAQHNKYDRILELLGDKSSDVLEIGCGWGGFAARAIETKDFKVKGITLSNEQYEYASKRLGKNANIVIEDYRKQQGKFDHIVSIEMFEAVGQKFWPVYFSKVSSLLKEKGKAVIQTITIADSYFDQYSKGSDMIRSFIFPGGMLPSETKFAEEAKKAGLRITDKFNFGKDYAFTLKYWLRNFDFNIRSVKMLGFDEKFIRIWRLYLASCIAGFSAERTDVIQFEVQHA